MVQPPSLCTAQGECVMRVLKNEKRNDGTTGFGSVQQREIVIHPQVVSEPYDRRRDRIVSGKVRIHGHSRVRCRFRPAEKFGSGHAMARIYSPAQGEAVIVHLQAIGRRGFL